MLLIISLRPATSCLPLAQKAFISPLMFRQLLVLIPETCITNIELPRDWKYTLCMMVFTLEVVTDKKSVFFDFHDP